MTRDPGPADHAVAAKSTAREAGQGPPHAAGAASARADESPARTADNPARADESPARAADVSDGEGRLARRVLDALLREDYGGLAARVTRAKEGVRLVLPSGRAVGLVPGLLFQDFVVAPHEPLALAEVLAALRAVASPADAEGVAAFAEECRAALRGDDLHRASRAAVLDRLRRVGPGPTIAFEALAGFAEHPVYPASRARQGLSDEEVTAYAPEFAPSFALEWVSVPARWVVRSGEPPRWWPGDGGPQALLPVHPLTYGTVLRIPGVTAAAGPRLRVRPTLSMRTVEVGARTHLKLPLATSTLGVRNRRSIKPDTLADGARAERLLREVLAREPGLDVLLADEQTYGHAGHEYLGWMVRRLPPGEIVPAAALLAPSPWPPPPGRGRRRGAPAPPAGRRVLDDLAARHFGGDARALLTWYLRTLMAWNVRLFVTYGIALEAHQQNLALVFRRGARPRLLVKDNDGLLASPDLLRRAGPAVPGFADRRMLTDDPHALADVFVTITLHLAAAAVAFGAGHGDLVAAALEEALDGYGGHPMARLLRARTLEAARLVGKSMVSAGTLADRARVAADVNKHYGTSGPNYLRQHLRGEAN
ncbi:IucA/IucC family protein [Sphaerisporangium sp. TRM90804]|uniref:IucA/IucC family protein n=1 Tax=Sphaerisporangium sp. TRM90804 TaxID=3031113 RepID=UPI00244B832F|nr:IucA/IucC family protein [Sphaerisporangium sp. TRM90804]MDH2429813.1 IucA/IucC family protein [Sphaerisporangium sp. TRM90804]